MLGKRSVREWGILAEAFACLALARVAIAVVHFRHLTRFLGELGVESPAVDEVSTLRRARGVGRAVRTVATRTPFASRCLAQALAARAMLRRRHIVSTAYLGMAHDGREENALEAHAWLRCGPLIVTGAEGRERFRVIASFATGRPARTAGASIRASAGERPAALQAKPEAGSPLEKGVGFRLRDRG